MTARLFCVLLLCLLASAPVFADADGSAAFSRGVEASRDGDHATALEHFEAARAAGLATPALDFNLGVTLYQLGRVDAARESFLRAWRSPRMAGPAAYRLGQIARAEGDTAAAADWFRQAARTARTERLQQQAWTALAELDQPQPRFSGLVSAGAGYDSNATRLPDDLAERDRESDFFVELFGYGRYQLDDGFYLFGSVSAEEYLSESEADWFTVQGGMGWREGPSANWRRDARVMLRQRYIDGDVFERALLGDFGATRAAGAGDVRLGAGLDFLEGASGFGFLDGYRLRGEARWRVPAMGGRWTLTGSASRVDRDDESADGFFASFSHTSIGAGVRHRRHLGSGRFLDLDAGWTVRRYDDREERGGETLDRRREAILRAGGEIEWPLAPSWQLVTRLDSTRRTSTIDTFEYDQLRFLMRLEREL